MLPLFPFLLLIINVLVSADSGPSDYSELDPARDPNTPLLPGSTGSEVIALQNALAAVTYYVEPPSGVFDDATVNSLINFQSAAGVPADEFGFVSVHTMEQFDSYLGIYACASYGLSRLTDAQVTTAISDGASKVLDSYWDYPVGTEVPYMADGETFIGRIEMHFHPWEGTVTPKGYHHGVSVYYFTQSLDQERVSGTEFLLFTSTMTVAQREDYIMLQLSQGNIPETVFDSWVNISSFDDATGLSITFQVLPDYLAIGHKSDFVRVPCAAFTAQKLADLYNASVPTTMMVDLIWNASTAKIEPQTMNPGDYMCSNAYIERENQLIEEQLSAIDAPNVEDGVRFVGGDKKDTVLTNQYADHPNSVAEYGWHQLNGEPIQPLYLGHSCDWADYSMGIRLVRNTVFVYNATSSGSGGSTSGSSAVSVMALADVLRDSQLAPLLSEEGVMPNPRVPVMKRVAAECWTPPPPPLVGSD